LKFVLTVVATVLLLLHMGLVDRLANIATEMATSGSHLHGLRIQIMADAAAAVALLIVNTVLSTYKPRGVIAYGFRNQSAQYGTTSETAYVAEANVPLWVKAFGITALVLLVLFRVAILHVSGGHGLPLSLSSSA